LFEYNFAILELIIHFFLLTVFHLNILLIEFLKKMKVLQLLKV